MSKLGHVQARNMAPCRSKKVRSLLSSTPEPLRRQSKRVGTGVDVLDSLRDGDEVTVTRGGRGGVERIEIPILPSKVEPHKGIDTEECLG